MSGRLPTVGLAGVTGRHQASGGEVRERMLTMPNRFRRRAAEGFAAEFGLHIDDDRYRIAIADGRCSVREEEPVSPAAKITTDARTWLELDAGSLSSIDAFLDDRIEVRGHVDHAVRMQSLFRPTGRDRTPQDLEQIEVYADGKRLSAYAFGEGPPVVLLHGLAATKLSYLPLLPALAERHRVIVPDLPGHGESTKRRGSYTPASFSRTVLALMDRLEVDRATLIGNSMGGRVSLEIAADAPERVEGLVLLDPAAAGIPFPLYARLLGLLPTGVGAVPVPWRKRLVVAGIRQLFAHPDRLPRNAYLAGADEFMRIYRSGRARVALLAAMRGLIADRPEAFWERAAATEARTLILWGQKDRLVPVRLGRQLARRMPDAELVVLPDVGHVPQFEVPEETRQLVMEFLDRLRPPTRRLPPAA